MDLYGWIKAFHIIAVIAWMAGMLYLPRLFVYHCAAEKGFRPIGNVQGDGAAAPAPHHQPGDDRDLDPWALARVARSLNSHYGWFNFGWLQAKLSRYVILPSAVHGLFARWVKAFAADRNRRSQKFYRIINEVPTIAMIIIVLLVVLKPF